MESKDLKFTGKGSIVHGEGEQETSEEFTIEGPITDFRFSFEVAPNGTAKMLQFKGFDFKIDAD